MPFNRPIYDGCVAGLIEEKTAEKRNRHHTTTHRIFLKFFLQKIKSPHATEGIKMFLQPLFLYKYYLHVHVDYIEVTTVLLRGEYVRLSGREFTYDCLPKAMVVFFESAIPALLVPVVTMASMPLSHHNDNYSTNQSVFDSSN